MIEIIHRYTKSVLYRSETATTLVEGIREANLEWAYLRGADLRGANMEGADLRGANMEGADLVGAYLEAQWPSSRRTGSSSG
jgi:uncharacterized protein YjbI with pentapeptide repeats